MESDKYAFWLKEMVASGLQARGHQGQTQRQEEESSLFLYLGPQGTSMGVMRGRDKRQGQEGAYFAPKTIHVSNLDGSTFYP